MVPTKKWVKKKSQKRNVAPRQCQTLVSLGRRRKIVKFRLDTTGRIIARTIRVKTTAGFAKPERQDLEEIILECGRRLGYGKP